VNSADGPQERASRSNVPFVVIGTFLVFIAMMFLNSARSATVKQYGTYLDGKSEYVAPEKVIMNTILAGSTGALATMFLKKRILPNHGTFSKHQTLNTGATCNGLVAGLVAVSASAQSMEQWAAGLVGVVGGINYLIGCRIFNRLRIDDPLESA